jgi:hypothetical protein
MSCPQFFESESDFDSLKKVDGGASGSRGGTMRGLTRWPLQRKVFYGPRHHHGIPHAGGHIDAYIL